MNAIKKVIGVFGAFLGGILLLSACIFPFTHVTGLHGYASIVIASSMLLALIGGLMLRGAGRSHPTMLEMHHGGHLDPRVADEIRKDRNRGMSLGAHLFYIGAVCAAVGYLLYRVTE